jgi:hypothetical protein
MKPRLTLLHCLKKDIHHHLQSKCTSYKFWKSLRVSKLLKRLPMHFTEEPLNIALVSPLMKRAHENTFAGENVFVDSTASCDEVAKYII